MTRSMCVESLTVLWAAVARRKRSKVPLKEPHEPSVEGEEESDGEEPLHDATAENAVLKAEVSLLHEELEKARAKIKSMWKLQL